MDFDSLGMVLQSSEGAIMVAKAILFAHITKEKRAEAMSLCEGIRYAATEEQTDCKLFVDL